MDPQQEFFTALRERLKERYPGKVYDTTLPPRNTPYPFIYLGGTEQVDTQTKSVLIGRVSQSVRVWHSSPHQRGTLSAMLAMTKRVARGIESTAHFKWDVTISMEQVMDDTTVSPPLLMGVLEITAEFSPLV